VTTILCVDQEPAVAALFEQILLDLGYGAVLADSASDAVSRLDQGGIDLVLADLTLTDPDGQAFLEHLRGRDPVVPFIVVSGDSSIEQAVMAMRSGAIDYVVKPVRAEKLQITIQHALEYARLRQENEAFRQEISRMHATRKLVGRSAAMRDLQEMVATVAPTRATVLLQGESGTGKELIARALHDQSPRSSRTMITINCAAMPEGLVESALFGHEKGAFTGATARAAGAFERAHGSTLLLDEISEMRLDLQSKLLRAIQEQEFERVGGREPIKVDVRLIATTNRDLRAEIAAGRFRADLYYRLQVVPIRTPPLRERPEDIPLLVQHFLRTAAEYLGVPAPEVPEATMDYLQRYSWPGNVRELSNAMERAVILARGRPISQGLFADHLHVLESPPSIALSSSTGTASSDDEMPLNLADLERITIERALVATGGNRTRAARLLGISERTLRNKLNSPTAA
jgi:DNA-binding NtrC family response regulator